MSIGTLWTKLMNLLRNVPFLDEALWDYGREWFKGNKDATATVATTTVRPNDNVLKARRAIGILYSDRVTDTARANWQKVVWGDPSFKPYQERVEVALEDLLERFEERDGAFPIQHGKKVVKETVEDKKKNTVTETPSGKEPRPNFGGHELFVQAVNKAGEEEQSLKYFINGITHERIFDRVGDQLALVQKQLKPVLAVIVTFFILYALMLLSTGWVATTRLMYFVENPTSLRSAIVGFVALGCFAWLASPITRRLEKG